MIGDRGDTIPIARGAESIALEAQHGIEAQFASQGYICRGQTNTLSRSTACRRASFTTLLQD